MMGILAHLRRPLSRLRANRRGAVAMMVALSGVLTMGMTAFVVDYGQIMVSQRTLQASTDAAALAGASVIGTSSADSTATSFGAGAGNANASEQFINPHMTTSYRCLTSSSAPCTGPHNANAIVVLQDATVPLTFAGILGFHTWPIAAKATAAAGAGKSIPLDVVIILDTTASMGNNADPNCSIANATRLTCALTGARTLMGTFSPSVDQVSLFVFPGVAPTSDFNGDFACPATNPPIVGYSSTTKYAVTGLASDYRTSDSANALSGTSNISKALGVGNNCGAKAPGGAGTYFAGAITAAQAELLSYGRSGVQKVMIILSDGTAQSGNISAALANNQCHQAITAAQAARDAGIWVYSIAYDAPTDLTGANTCTTDTVANGSSAISPCDTMKQLASDSTKFYSDIVSAASTCTSNANSASDIVNAFKRIGAGFKNPRLLPNDAT